MILPRGIKKRIRYADHIIEDGGRFFAELEKQRLEGMVAKRADGRYIDGRTRDWLKIKTIAEACTFIGGCLTTACTRRPATNSLMNVECGRG